MVEVTVKSALGSVRVKDNAATLGETTLNDILAAATETLQSFDGGEGVTVKLPFGFTAVPGEDDDG
jgi:hypothetical protein